MDFERTIETQRLRLLRLVAGLVVLVGFLSVGPVSRRFSIWTCRYVGSVLSRAETAARYLVIAQAHRMVADSGFDVDRRQISDCLTHAFVADEASVSVSACKRRLKVLRAVLTNVPHHALRLLRRIEKWSRRAMGVERASPCPDARLSASLCERRLAGIRIERPPDRDLPVSHLTQPPPGYRAGGHR